MIKQENLDTFKDAIFERSNHEYAYKAFLDLYEHYKSYPLELSLPDLISLIDEKLCQVKTGCADLTEYGKELYIDNHETLLAIDAGDDDYGLNSTVPHIFKIAFEDVIATLGSTSNYVDLFVLFYYIDQYQKALKNKHIDATDKVDAREGKLDVKESLRLYLKENGYAAVAFEKVPGNIHHSIQAALNGYKGSVDLRIGGHEAFALVYFLARSKGFQHEKIAKWLPETFYEIVKKKKTVTKVIEASDHQESLIEVKQGLNIISSMEDLQGYTKGTYANYLKTTSGSGRFLGYMANERRQNVFNDVKLSRMKDIVQDLLPNETDRLNKEIDSYDKNPIQYLGGDNYLLYVCKSAT